jgi:hypothetical protein
MFSVVIATRDRPHLLRRALRSVAAQTFRDFELILVDDSANEPGRAVHAALLQELLPSGKLCLLPREQAGHGPGSARNRGIEQAGGEYIAFLDDDDEWIDATYLETAVASITRLKLDLHIADQEAVRPDGSVVAGPVWTEDLARRLPSAGLVASAGTFLVSQEQLLLSDGFAHLNTTIVRRSLAWDSLGGFDGSIPYEEDRDFQLRAIDAADAIGYTPRLVARHHVPAARASASSIPQAERDSCRLRVLEKSIRSATHEAIRARCRRDRAYTLKHMSQQAAQRGEFAAARRYGREALEGGFGVKWLLYLGSLYIRSAFARRFHAS